MRILPLAIAAAILLVSSGCVATSHAETGPESTPSATTPPVSETPTATSPVNDPADPMTWVINAEGIGPLRLGTPLDAAVAMLPGYAVSSCPNPAVRMMHNNSPTEPTLQLAADDDGLLSLITLYNSTGPQTNEGVRIGSTVAEAKAVYPELEFSQHFTDRYTLRGEPGWLTLEPATIDAGDTAAIVTVSVVTGGLPPSELCG